jgi:hypothetical protein
MSYKADYKFEGWQALAEDSVQGKFEWKEFEPKAFAEDDVDSASLPPHSPTASCIDAVSASALQSSSSHYICP